MQIPAFVTNLQISLLCGMYGVLKSTFRLVINVSSLVPVNVDTTSPQWQYCLKFVRQAFELSIDIAVARSNELLELFLIK